MMEHKRTSYVLGLTVMFSCLAMVFTSVIHAESTEIDIPDIKLENTDKDTPKIDVMKMRQKQSEPLSKALNANAVSTQLTQSGWGSWISEETPPTTCQNLHLITAMACKGDYCDDTRIACSNTYQTYGYNYWTSWFSEEGYNYRYCNIYNKEFMTGVACKGDYCDNVSIQCTQLPNARVADACYWTDWFSEENGGVRELKYGYYAAGIQCRGSYCDDKRILACHMY